MPQVAIPPCVDIYVLLPKLCNWLCIGALAIACWNFTEHRCDQVAVLFGLPSQSRKGGRTSLDAHLKTDTTNCSPFPLVATQFNAPAKSLKNKNVIKKVSFKVRVK
jgi:hypothetical protein